MPATHDDEPPQYTRYRVGPRLLPRREAGSLSPPRGAGELLAGWRRRITPKRVLLGLLALVVGWLALSLLLFLLSSHFERNSPPSSVARVLDSASFPLTSANNILVLGSESSPEDEQGTRRQRQRAQPLGHDHADPHGRRTRRAPVDPTRHRA